MDRDLNFNDSDDALENDLSFDDYSDDVINEVIKDINSGLCFELPENPLVEDISASSKLLNIFEQRSVEIEHLLLNTKLSEGDRKDLQLESRMIKTAFTQYKRKY